MNSGSFFRLDLKASKVVEGVTFFNYIDLPALDCDNDGLRYPIRISISSDNVSFFLHYFKDGENPRHTEEEILTFNFVNHDCEALSSSLKRSYNSYFPLNQSYLDGLIHARYDNHSKHDEYASIRDSLINKASYSSLFVWGLVENPECCTYQLSDTEGKTTRFLRKLILDFMFDMMHSSVFEVSKYYVDMRKGLLSDFFFSSIVKKSEYYYYRRLIRNQFRNIKTFQKGNDYLLTYAQRRKEEQQTKQKEKQQTKREEDQQTDKILSAIHKLYAERIQESESDWIDVIMSPMAEKHFTFSPEWYEEGIKQEKHRNFNISESWFVDPEEEMRRIVFPLINEKKHEEFHYLNSFELSNFIGTKDNSSILSRITMISKWFYSRFDFNDAWRLHLFAGANYAFVAILLVFTLVSVVSYGFWQTPKFFAIFPLAASIGSLCAFFMLHWSAVHHGKQELIDNLLINKRRKRERNVAFRLSIFFFALWLFFYFSESSSFLEVVTKSGLMLLLAVFLLLLYPNSHKLENIHLFLPRLVASITAGWIMLVIGNDLVKEHVSKPLWIIISLVVFTFIMYENNKALPHLAVSKRIFRALELMLISYSMSLIIGIFAIDVLSPSLLQDAQESQLLPQAFEWTLLRESKNLTMTIFPEFLIQFSFLAMFIGVFIQMIFEEKNITDM